MEKQLLNGKWQLEIPGYAPAEGEKLSVSIPGSVYSGLLENGKMEDPFWRDNELEALKIMEHDFIFTRSFDLEAPYCDKYILVCEGLDTICDIELNGQVIGYAENMHRTWEFPVQLGIRNEELGVKNVELRIKNEELGVGSEELMVAEPYRYDLREPKGIAGQARNDVLKEKGNVLKITFRSPTKAIAERYAAVPTDGTGDAMRGYTQLRKAHCMFGWDWGPRLPDAGIWRDIYIVGTRHGERRIDSVYVRQRHERGLVELSFELGIRNEELGIRSEELGVRSEGLGVRSEGLGDKRHCGLDPQSPADFGGLRLGGRNDGTACITVTSPTGEVWRSKGEPIVIENPQLWWPSGYGGQPLYTVKVDVPGDSWERRIGLRTLTVKREKDEWGESFAFAVNGLSIFAMGADYIPQDNILSRITPRRIRALLEDCVEANYNCIRVWGGGYYPDDSFYDACDELGLIVWQDFMFACGVYELTDEFEENIRAEFVDNIKRIRHHASLGLWCGNNEMEWQFANGSFKMTPKQRADYTRIFGYIIPKTLKKHDPDTFHWPSSPSSGGDFDEPCDENRGNVHYWEVWHGLMPFSDYRNHYFRFCTEFGFQSFPDIKTVRSFTEPEDRNIFSRVMEMHQRNMSANGKIMFYLSSTYRYPRSFETLLYASQLLQADAIRYGVEHWRRNRRRCMGSIYWQINDIWPVASWASIDYFGRWKALHYFAKRFYAPVMLSCCETGEMTERPSPVSQREPIKKAARFSLANETGEVVSGTVKWALRDPLARIVKSGEIGVTAEVYSSAWLDEQSATGGELDFSDCDELSNYVSFEFVPDGQLNLSTPPLSGTALFCMPKHFNFVDPELSFSIDGSSITVTAKAFAKSVEIYSDSEDFVLSDNFFDMNAGRVTVQILRGSAKNLKARSVFDI